MGIFNNINNKNVIYSDYIKDRQANVLVEMKNLGMKGYISNNDRYEEFFNNVTNILKKSNYISYGYKATNIWFTDSRLCSYDEITPNKAYLIITVIDGSYNDAKLTSGYCSPNSFSIKINEETLSLILDECVKLINHIKRIIDESKNMSDMDEILNTLLQYAQKYICIEKYTANIERGNLNKEDNNAKPYCCLVVRNKKDNTYHSSIVIEKNQMGEYIAIHRTPLCGETKYTFMIDDAEKAIKNIINL